MNDLGKIGVLLVGLLLVAGLVYYIFSRAEFDMVKTEYVTETNTIADNKEVNIDYKIKAMFWWRYSEYSYLLGFIRGQSNLEQPALREDWEHFDADILLAYGKLAGRKIHPHFLSNFILITNFYTERYRTNK